MKGMIGYRKTQKDGHIHKGIPLKPPRRPSLLWFVEDFEGRIFKLPGMVALFTSQKSRYGYDFSSEITHKRGSLFKPEEDLKSKYTYVLKTNYRSKNNWLC